MRERRVLEGEDGSLTINERKQYVNILPSVDAIVWRFAGSMFVVSLREFSQQFGKPPDRVLAIVCIRKLWTHVPFLIVGSSLRYRAT